MNKIYHIQVNILQRTKKKLNNKIYFKEILEKIAFVNDDDTLLRPTFPNQQNLNNDEEAYSLQLLSTIEACWLEIPEMRPSIKRIKSLINSNFKTK